MQCRNGGEDRMVKSKDKKTMILRVYNKLLGDGKILVGGAAHKRLRTLTKKWR